MELDYFHEFLVLAQHRNYHLAAQELGISQPTLTNHIKKLETELGVALFDRNTRSIHLTEYGHTLQPYATGLTQMYSSARRAIHSKQNNVSPVLTVGMEPQYMVGNLLRTISRYKAEHPNTVIEFTNVSETYAANMLRSGRCDLAITPQITPEHPEFRSVVLREEHAVAFVHRNHPLASRKTLGIEDLIGENLFIPPARLILYKLLRSAHLDAGFELDASCMGVTEPMGLLLVRQGLGIMITSDYAAQKLTEEALCVIPLQPELKWYVNLLYTDVHFSPEGKNFLDYIHAELSKEKTQSHHQNGEGRNT